MSDFAREMIAYGLLTVIVLVGVPWLVVALKRRHRHKLRQQGIKRYGH